MSIARSRTAFRGRFVSMTAATAILILMTLTAAPLPAAPLSLDECIEIALRNNPSLKGARAGVEADRAGHLSSYSAFLPSVSAAWGFSRDTSSRDRLFFQGNTIEVGKGTSDTYSARYNLSQNLVTPSEWLRHSASKQSLRAGEESFRATESEVKYQVRLQYFRLVQAILLEQVSREAEAVAQEQLNKSQALFDLGSVARTDVLQARVNQAAAGRTEISARNSIEEERARLAVLLGMEVTQPLEVRLDITDTAPVEENEAALMADARETRPELRQAEALHRAARLQSKSAFWTLLPSVGGSMYYSKSWDKFWDSVDPSEIDRNAQWGFGVDLTWRVFDGLASYGDYKRSKAQAVAAAEDLRRQELEASLAVRQAQVAVKNAREGITAASESVALAEENLRLQQALYENGGGTILEVNNAQAELTRAKNDLVDARIALQTAIAQQERALGR